MTWPPPAGYPMWGARFYRNLDIFVSANARSRGHDFYQLGAVLASKWEITTGRVWQIYRRMEEQQEWRQSRYGRWLQARAGRIGRPLDMGGPRGCWLEDWSD